MPAIEHFEDLQVWQLARIVTSKVYDCSKNAPFSKDFGLRDQMQRAAVSILSNVAEGFERRSDNSFHQFLSIANGSAAELRAQLYVALDQGYISRQKFDELRDDVVRIGKMLASLMSYLRNSPPRDRKTD